MESPDFSTDPVVEDAAPHVAEATSNSSAAVAASANGETAAATTPSTGHPANATTGSASTAALAQEDEKGIAKASDPPTRDGAADAKWRQCTICGKWLACGADWVMKSHQETNSRCLQKQGNTQAFATCQHCGKAVSNDAWSLGQHHFHCKGLRDAPQRHAPPPPPPAQEKEAVSLRRPEAARSASKDSSSSYEYYSDSESDQEANGSESVSPLASKGHVLLPISERFLS